MTAYHLVGFGLALLPIVLSPGASFTLVTSRALRGDPRGARQIMSGTALGILTHALLAGLGLAAVVMASAYAYTVIRIVGAVVLVALGIRMLWRARRPAGRTDAAQPEEVASHRGGAVAMGYVSNVLNIKAAAVYLTLAPQFVPAHAAGPIPVLALGLVHVLLMVSWLTLWGWGLRRAARWVDPRRWIAWFDRTGAVALIIVGARTAVGRT